MKKIKYLFVGVICLLLVGCGASDESKNVGSLSDFESIASNNNFVIEDNMSNYIDVNYITEAKIATLDDVIVEMIVYTDIDSTKKVQDGQIDSFRKIKNTGVTEHKDEGKNYYKFWMVSNGYYVVSSRVDNTLIFCKTMLKNKEKIEAILDSMNY